MGIKGKSSVVSFNSRPSFAKANVIPDGRQRNDLFHLRVISKNTMIDMFVDSGSQVNLISKQVV
jgi:hypothetical protein